MKNWRQTWVLAAVAAVFFAFIMLYERRIDPGRAAPSRAQRLLPGWPAPAVTAVQFQRNADLSLNLKASRTGEKWALTEPLSYPASGTVIEAVLRLVEKAEIRTRLPLPEATNGQQTLASFGLEPPLATLTLWRETNQVELFLGTNTPAADQIYARVGRAPEICVVGQDLALSLPHTMNEWRDTVLFTTESRAFDHVVIARSSGEFLLERDPTNRVWRLARPAHRADPLKMTSLLGVLLEAHALQFVTDNSNADLEGYGLLTPELEVTLLLGTNLVERVQFGKSPTNDATRVYARRASHANVVLVARSLVETLATPVADLRDRRLVTLPPGIDTIEVRSEEPFTVRQQTNDSWTVGEGWVADALFVRSWLEHLNRLQVEFVKDVVTDFSSYGLALPSRQYLFKTTITNALGPTNLVMVQLDFGTNQNDRIFVRRADEDSVYSIRLLDYYRMPSASWQLRSHQVWTFTTNEVARVIVRQGGQTRQLIRNAKAEWTTGTDQPPQPMWSLEETLFRLGDLRAVAWTARGETNRAAYGFTETGHVITLELKGERPRSLTLEFGGLSPAGMPYAAATVDGQWWIFEFPWPIYPDIKRDLSLPQ